MSTHFCVMFVPAFGLFGSTRLGYLWVLGVLSRGRLEPALGSYSSGCFVVKNACLHVDFFCAWAANSLGVLVMPREDRVDLLAS